MFWFSTGCNWVWLIQLHLCFQLGLENVFWVSSCNKDSKEFNNSNGNLMAATCQCNGRFEVSYGVVFMAQWCDCVPLSSIAENKTESLIFSEAFIAKSKYKMGNNHVTSKTQRSHTVAGLMWTLVTPGLLTITHNAIQKTCWGPEWTYCSLVASLTWICPGWLQSSASGYNCTALFQTIIEIHSHDSWYLERLEGCAFFSLCECHEPKIQQKVCRNWLNCVFICCKLQIVVFSANYLAT